MTSEPSPFETAVASLVAGAVPEIVNVQMRDRPDADLTHKDGCHIGLEVVRTVDRVVAFGQKRMIEARDAIESALEQAAIVGSFDVRFDLIEIGDGNGRAFDKWLRGIKKRLPEALRASSASHLDKGTLEALGIQLIDAIAYEPNETLSVGHGYVQRFFPGDSVAENVLREKDERLRGYEELNGSYFKSYWLVIASLGPGTLDDGGYMKLMNRDFSTRFERVFLIFRGPSPYAKEITPLT